MAGSPPCTSTTFDRILGGVPLAVPAEFPLLWGPAAGRSSAVAEAKVPLLERQASIGWYATARLLSLDVVAGAVGCGCMVAGYLEVAMHWSWYVVLPLAVWAVYTADHLLDAAKLGEEASTQRHRFHHRFRKPLAILAGLSALGAVGLALAFLGVEGLLFGAGMGLLVVLHLTLVRIVGGRTSPFLLKELGVAVIYAAGIWGLPMWLSGKAGTREALLPAIQFMLLALVNLIEFSLYEYKTDTADGQTSFVRAVGPRLGIRFIRLVLATAAGLGVFLLSEVDGVAVLRVEFIYLVMTLILAALVFKPLWFAVNERYRTWGDAAFLLPFLFPLMDLL